MDYKDRRTGLLLFGILWVLMGLAQGGTSLLMVAGTVAGGPGAMPMRMAVPVALMYLAVGTGFVLLGIGSIMARRWARALILVLSWMWLITGVVSIGVLVAVMPRFFDTMPAEQAAEKPVILGCMAVLFGVLFMLLPGISLLFYRGKNVKATVDARDPVHRWTDDVPLPLLAFVVWMVGGAAGVLICGLMYPSFPVGRWMIRGIGVPAMMVVLASILFFIGVGSLRRFKAAWWTAVAMFPVGVAWGLTFMRGLNVAEWYREMGVPTDSRQIDLMEGMYGSPMWMAWVLVFWGAYLGYLLYLRRYFQNVNRMYPPST